MFIKEYLIPGIDNTNKVCSLSCADDEYVENSDTPTCVKRISGKSNPIFNLGQYYSMDYDY